MVAYGTGNAIVDEVGKLSITGDVTPRAWYQTVVREDGRPFLLAIAILSDVTYWYRPREVRDEGSSMVVRWERRFADERWLSRSYDQICDSFGCSRRECAYALKRLEEIGVIRRHTRTVRRVVAGVERVMTGVLFIELVPSVLRELTFPGGRPEGPEGAPSTPDQGSAEAGQAAAPDSEADEVAREIDSLAPRKARARFGELCREVADASRALSIVPADLARAYRTYVTTPGLWPGRSPERMVRFALTWCRDRHLVTACLARAGCDGPAPYGSPRQLCARERAEGARLVRASSGISHSWVAILSGPAETMELCGLRGGETEDEAREELLRELRERERGRGST